MSVRIITDSASDISQQTASEWNICVIPLHVRFGEEEFLDGITLNNHDFYDRLAQKEHLPKTSQIPPFSYEEKFEEAIAAGEDVLCITISHDLSGCYQSACIAADNFPEGRIHVLDSRQVCLSEYLLVKYAVRLRDEGHTLQEMIPLLEEAKKKVRLLIILNTLEYLQLGGRISKTAAFAGSLLSIRPLLTMENGVVTILGKARGSRAGNSLLVEHVGKSGGIDFSMPLGFAYSGNSEEAILKYIEESSPLYADHSRSPEKDYPVIPMGCTVGTYAGADAVAIAFFHP